MINEKVRASKYQFADKNEPRQKPR